MKNEKSCGTIVLHKNKNINEYLLLHYIPGHWDFPKGHVEKGETEEATALRELEEETGITNTRLIPGFCEEINYFFKKKNVTISKQVLFFLVESKEKNVVLSHEHTGYKWLNYEDALKQLVFNNSKKLLIKAETFLKQKQYTTA